MFRPARVALGTVVVLALGACSAGGEGAQEANPPSSTTSTRPAPSTRGAPTTTLSPQQQDEADIRALHDRFFRMLVLTGNPPDPDHPEIAATTTGTRLTCARTPA